MRAEVQSAAGAAPLRTPFRGVETVSTPGDQTGIGFRMTAWVCVLLQVSSPGKALNLYPSNEYEVLPSGSEAHWEVVERILFIYAKLNPGIAYVQGMNEIVGPIYYTFVTDPNTEWKGL